MSRQRLYLAWLVLSFVALMALGVLCALYDSPTNYPGSVWQSLDEQVREIGD